MDVVPIKGKAYDRRMSQPLIVRVAVEAFGAVWVAVVVVVVSFPRVSIAPVDLTGDPGGLAPVVVVWEHWHPVDGHPNCTGSWQARYTLQRVRHCVAASLHTHMFRAICNQIHT